MNIYGVDDGLRSRMSDVNQETDRTINKLSVTLLGKRCADRVKICMWYLRICSMNWTYGAFSDWCLFMCFSYG